MTAIDAIIIGIVEGITEYLPVSSTGHIILAERALDIKESKEVADAFAVVIQAGAILAVLGLYFQRVKGMAMGLAGKNPEGLLLVRNLLLAFIPAAAAGLLFKKKINEHLFNLWAVTAAWFVGGVAILAVAWFRRGGRGRTRGEGLSLTQITPKIAIFIGLMQCVALWPGTSRSLMTIVAGLLAGLTLTAALEFSFLLGMITLTAASLKEGWDQRHALFSADMRLPMALGLVAAWISAVLAVKWLVGFLQKRGITPFGYYRIGLAIVVTALLMAGKLSSEVEQGKAEEKEKPHAQAQAAIYPEKENG